MAIIIVVCKGSDLRNVFMKLLEMLGHRMVGDRGGFQNMRGVRKAGKIVAQPMVVRLLELASTDGENR